MVNLGRTGCLCRAGKKREEEENMKKERLEAALKLGSNRGKSLDEVQFHMLLHISYA